jgi:hypothetical protein
MRRRAARPEDPANMKLSLIRLPFSSQKATVLAQVAVFEARSLDRRPPERNRGGGVTQKIMMAVVVGEPANSQACKKNKRTIEDGTQFPTSFVVFLLKHNVVGLGPNLPEQVVWKVLCCKRGKWEIMS